MPETALPSDPTIAPEVVLLVEDEWPNRALLRATLSRSLVARVRDVVLVEATNLAQARAVLAERSVNLIVLDVRLPDGSGLTLARELSEAGERPRILVLSASVLPEERLTALEAGTDVFMAKPYLPADLVAAMGSLLNCGPVRRPAGPSLT